MLTVRALVAALLATLIVTVPSPATADTAHGWVPLYPQPGYVSTWQQGQTITYTVNLDGSTALQQRALDTLRGAVRTMQRETGLDFRPIGYSHRANATLQVEFRAHNADPLFTRYAMAYAGPTSFTLVRGRVMFRTAEMVVDWSRIPRMTAAQQRVYYLHELGHVVGLAHVRGSIQVMNVSPYLVALQPGDLLGLHTLYPGYRRYRR